MRFFRYKKLLYSIFLVVIFSFIIINFNVEAGNLETASKYAPILYFESSENFYPVDVSFHIDNSDLKVYGETSINIPANTLDLDNLSIYMSSADYTYLDNRLGTIYEYQNILSTYQNEIDDLGYKIYYRVYDESGYTIIQYWMFYAFNEGELNQHEGDWEMVQVVLLGDSPVSVAYSQHYEGQSVEWDKAEYDDTHVKVYIARGSHANYLRSYRGKLGISNDYVGDNGLVLLPQDYSLENLEDQYWLNYSGFWGEFSSLEDYVMGRVGPKGPMYREKMPNSGIKLWEGTNWGSSISDINILYIPMDWSTFNTLNWIMYNFILLYSLISLAIIGIMSLIIYRRHKKYGLGPRIFSMAYIDGLNLNTIGNILCIVGIIVTLFAIFQPWYSISYAISGTEEVGYLATDGMTELINIDGGSGMQVNIPSSTGPIPVATLSLPFGFFILIGLVFTIIATIGICKSGKLGRKYLYRGIKMLVPIILIIVIIILISDAVSQMVSSMISSGGSFSITDIISPLVNGMKASPLGGQESLPVTQGSITADVDFKWGLMQGGYFLIYASIIFILAGIFEIVARKNFFEKKVPTKKERKKNKIKDKKNSLFKKKDENKGMKIDVSKEDDFEDNQI